MADRAGVGSRVFAQVGHIDHVPFADATFDLVVVIGVSEWLVSLTATPARDLPCPEAWRASDHLCR